MTRSITPRLLGATSLAAVTLSLAPAAAQTCLPRTVLPDGAGEAVDGHVPGIYVASSNLPLNLPPEGDPRRDTVLACTWDDARVLGGNVIVPWSSFDAGPEAGTDRYDFAFAEEQIDLWASRGKKANLLVWSSAQQAKQEFGGRSMTPQWLFDAGVPTVTCDPDGEGGDPALPTIPVHNDPVVRARFQEALRSIYERYKDDPRVNYVRFGAGVGSENYPINASIQTNGACRAAWEAKGGDAEAWRAHVLEMVRFFGTLQNEGGALADTPNAPDLRTAAAQDNAPIVVSLNDYKGTTQVPQIPRAAFNEAKVRRLGIGTQGPTDLHRRNYEDGRRGACTANWCLIFDDAKADPRVPILEIQTPNATGPLGLSPADGTGPGYTRTGPLQTLAPFLLERGTTSFELYPAEFRIANDESGNPFNAEYGAIYDEALDAIAVGAVDNAREASPPPPTGGAFGTRPIKDVVEEAGLGVLPFEGSDQGKRDGLRLTSFGRTYDEAGPTGSVFRVRNANETVLTATLDPIGGTGVALDLPPRSDVFVLSPVADGAATHRLFGPDGTQVDVKAASDEPYADVRPVLTAEAVPAGAGGVADARALPREDGPLIELEAFGQGLDRPVSAGGYLRQTLGGNGELAATTRLGTAPGGASAGLMLRAGGAGTGGGSKFVALLLEKGGVVRLLIRDEASAAPVEAGRVQMDGPGAVSLRLARSGNTFVGFADRGAGEVTVGTATGAIPGGPINAGLFAASGTATSTVRVAFTDATLIER